MHRMAYIQDLDETIRDLEVTIEHLHHFSKHLPAPCLLYTKDERIAWCNQSMLNLFFATTEDPKYTPGHKIFGKKCEEVMPDYLWPYVIEQNEIVFKTQKSQYEEWSDEVMVSIIWRCLRFPAGSSHVGVILFPRDEQYLALCDRALKEVR